eukprot:scaffold269587_cov30-Tisochrysis_lutea.AAC.2
MEEKSGLSTATPLLPALAATPSKCLATVPSNDEVSAALPPTDDGVCCMSNFTLCPGTPSVLDTRMGPSHIASPG